MEDLEKKGRDFGSQLRRQLQDISKTLPGPGPGNKTKLSQGVLKSLIGEFLQKAASEDPRETNLTGWFDWNDEEASSFYTAAHKSLTLQINYAQFSNRCAKKKN